MFVNGRLRAPGSRVDIRQGVPAGHVPIMPAKTVDLAVIYRQTIARRSIPHRRHYEYVKTVHVSTRG